MCDTWALAIDKLSKSRAGSLSTSYLCSVEVGEEAVYLFSLNVTAAVSVVMYPHLSKVSCCQPAQHTL